MSEVAHHEGKPDKKYYLIRETISGEPVYVFVEALKFFYPPKAEAQSPGAGRDALLDPLAGAAPGDGSSGYGTVATAYGQQSANNVSNAVQTTAQVGTDSSAIGGKKT